MKSISTCIDFIFQRKTCVYLLKVSITYNKKWIPPLNLLINYTLARSAPQILSINPPGKETSWRRCGGIFWYVPMTSQERLKWNTQWRLSGTSPGRLTGTSPRCHRGTLGRRLKDRSLGRHIGMSLRRPKPVSNETPNYVSVVRRQDASLVRLHDFIEEHRDDVWRICP